MLQQSVIGRLGHAPVRVSSYFLLIEVSSILPLIGIHPDSRYNELPSPPSYCRIGKKWKERSVRERPISCGKNLRIGRRHERGNGLSRFPVILRVVLQRFEAFLARVVAYGDTFGENEQLASGRQRNPIAVLQPLPSASTASGHFSLGPIEYVPVCICKN
jgi:hypothetical protein